MLGSMLNTVKFRRSCKKNLATNCTYFKHGNSTLQFHVFKLAVFHHSELNAHHHYLGWQFNKINFELVLQKSHHNQDGKTYD